MRIFFEGGKSKYVALVMAMSMCLGACGYKEENAPDDNIEEETVDNSNVDLSGIEYPVAMPNTLVDQVGYRTGAEKIVIFRGEELPETFDVVDAQTDEVVYTGVVRKSVYNEELDEYDSYGYFSDLQENGRYYIYTDLLGSSYEFEIKEYMYDEIFDAACKKYFANRCGIEVTQEYAGDDAHVNCHSKPAHLQEDPSKEIEVSGGWHLDSNADRYVYDGCLIAENLLLGYEMYPDQYGDDTGILESGNDIPDVLDEVKYEVDWLLKMQDESTGGLYGAAVTDISNLSEGESLLDAPVYVTPVDMEATAEFCCIMARFSYMYKDIDSEYATTCLKAADRAWSCYTNNVNKEEDTAAFKAAAELYRASGSSKYEAVLTSYFSRENYPDMFNEDENILWGSVTYISTNQKVNTDICNQAMKLLMKKAAKVAENATNSTYFVTNPTKEGIDELLDDMRVLTIADHIIYNHEYTTIIENHVHYMLGRNPLALNYITTDTDRTYLDDDNEVGILNDPVRDSKLIFMMSVIKE